MTLMTLRRVLLGLTLGVVLALVIAPQTRWLVQAQAQSLLHLPTASESSGDEQAQEDAAASRHPNDYQLQFSDALSHGGSSVNNLRRLKTRFPNSASLRANILRYACTQIHTDRDENYLSEQLPIPPSSRHSPPDGPAQLAAFDRDAAAGERLDPDNAYFPFMRAIGLYAAHRDAEAQDALLRAGMDARWDEYTQDEVEGRWRLSALVFGGSAHDAVARSAVAAAELFPHYAALRAVARVATYQAIQEEQAGNFSRGIALRQALVHCGGLMRAQSGSIIGALVGIAIVHVGMGRPGGTPIPPDTVRQQSRMDRAAAYAAYLRHHGDGTGAAQAVAEEQADRQVRALLGTTSARLSPYTQLLSLLPWWMAGLLLLINALWLLGGGALAPLLGRLRPLSRPLAFGGVLLLLVLGGALAIWTAQGAREYDSVIKSLNFEDDATPSSGFALWAMVFPGLRPTLITLTALAVPLLVLLIGLVRRRRAPIHRTVAAAAVPLACLILLAYAGVTLVTTRQERAINMAITQSLPNEGQYIAAQAGQVWPGAVD